MYKSGPMGILLFATQQPVYDISSAGEESFGLVQHLAITHSLAAEEEALVMDADAGVLKLI